MTPVGAAEAAPALDRGRPGDAGRAAQELLRQERSVHACVAAEFRRWVDRNARMDAAARNANRAVELMRGWLMCRRVEAEAWSPGPASPQPTRSAVVTDRERLVLALADAGLTNAEIAERLALGASDQGESSC